MNKLLVLFLGLLLAGVVSTSSKAQGGYGTPCAGGVNCNICCVNPTPLPPGEYLWVECMASSCGADPDSCGPCKQVRIRNMYSCKNITKVEFRGPTLNGISYRICQKFQNQVGHDGEPCQDAQWIVTVPSSQIWNDPCWISPNGKPGENWWITPDPNGPCPGGAAQGWWIYIDFCGSDLGCDKITLIISFSDGTSCSVNLANIGSCCP